MGSDEHESDKQPYIITSTGVINDDIAASDTVSSTHEHQRRFYLGAGGTCPPDSLVALPRFKS